MDETTKKEQIFFKNKKVQTIILILLIGFLLYKTIDYFGAIGYRETWTICIDYMNEGVFWAGQPHCEGALIPFYVIWTLDAIFGREYVQVATIVFSTLISIGFWCIFWNVVKKECNTKSFFLPALLFWLLFYINTITNLEAVLNSFFFFCAYYVLFYREERWKYYAAGLLLLLSLHAKINVIIQIVFLIFWYGYEKRVWCIENKKIKIQIKKEVLLGYCQLALPIIAGFAIAAKVYEYFWVYAWSVFTNQNIALSILETTKEMILFDITKTDIIYIVVLATALMCTYLFWKERKFYALIAGPVFLLAIFMIIRAFGIQFATGVRYWSVIFPFVILSILRLREVWGDAPKKQILYGMLIFIVIYPGMYQGPFLLKDDLSYIDNLNIVDKRTKGWQEKDALVKQIHYGYSIVPEQEGRILIEDDPAGFKRKIVSFNANIPYEKVDFLTKKYMESHPDIWGFPRYQELLGENLLYETTTSMLNEKEKEVVKKIEDGTYSLIIFGPPEWAITEKILANVNNETISEYCQVLVPNNVWLTEGGWHFSYFMFKNREDCQGMAEKMYQYFSQEYQQLCTKDKGTANMITAVLRQNGLPFDKVCAEGGDGLERAKTGEAIKKAEILLMIILFSLPLVYGAWKESDSEKRKKYYKIMMMILIMFIFVIIFMSGEVSQNVGIVEAIG